MTIISIICSVLRAILEFFGFIRKVKSLPSAILKSAEPAALPEKKPLRISQRGVELIKICEGCRLSSYRCSANVLTIGYGHASGVWEGLVIDQAEADRLLAEDLEKFESGVRRLVKVDLTQGQFDALVSFAFNLGLGNLEMSGLLRLVNSGEFIKASEQFSRWDFAGGKRLAGLSVRRAKERDLFNE